MLTSEEKAFITESVHLYARALSAAGYRVLPIEEVRFSRALRTFGSCRKNFDASKKNFVSATITISESCLKGTDDCLKNVILHELIHAMPDTENHDAKWQEYAREISERFGASIHTHVGEDDADAVYENCHDRFRWHVRCDTCGYTWHFVKKTKFVKNALRHGRKFHHSCGGSSFSVVHQESGTDSLVTGGAQKQGKAYEELVLF